MKKMFIDICISICEDIYMYINMPMCTEILFHKDIYKSAIHKYYHLSFQYTYNTHNNHNNYRIEKTNDNKYCKQ